MKKFWISLSIVLLVILTGVTVFVASTFKTTAQKTAEASPPPKTELTDVVRKEQLRSTAPVTCSVGYSKTMPLNVGAEQGSGQFTKIAVRQGETIKQGSLVAEVNGEPIFAVIGGFSLYRNLRVDDRGPDAVLINQALTALRYQPARTAKTLDLVDKKTFAALDKLYRSFGYHGPKDDAEIQAANFTVLPEEATVVDQPRATGAVSDGPIATVSTSHQSLRCTGANGSELTPEAKAGQHLILPTLGTTEYVLSEVVDNAPNDANTGATNTKPGVVVTSPGSDAGQNPKGNAPTSQHIAVAPLGDGDAEKATTTMIGDLVVSESAPDALVVPSAALWNQDGQTKVTVVSGGHSTDVPVQVTFTAEGKNAVMATDGELHEGDAVRIALSNGGTS